MFEPKKTTSVSKSIRMDEDLVSRLQTVANEYGISFNQMISQCCQYALNSLDPRSGSHGVNLMEN